MLKKLLIYGLIILTFPLTLLALSFTAPSQDDEIINFANTHLLPDQFVIYTNGNGAINHPVPGFMKKILPTNNDYKGMPGCYISCYSHSKEAGIYRVSSTIYVYGQVRVPGKYDDRNCIPTGYRHKDISAEKSFENLCTEKISGCKTNHCWAGGETGGWFGIE